MDETRFQQALAAAQNGDQQAQAELAALLHVGLRQSAERLMRGQRQVTLQPTVLLNETWLKLFGQGTPSVQDRQHFLAQAALAMRQIVVDYARRRSADKRDVDCLVELPQFAEIPSADVLDVDRALHSLAELDPDAAQLVQLRYFAGLGIDECAALLDWHPSKVNREWAHARSYLITALQ
jgi:RNA polymerase sigma factor (TIGR02999 family)